MTKPNLQEDIKDVRERWIALPNQHKVDARKNQLDLCVGENAVFQPKDLEKQLRYAAQDEELTNEGFAQVAQHYYTLRAKYPQNTDPNTASENP